jgi:hypothetical protein
MHTRLRFGFWLPCVALGLAFTTGGLRGDEPQPKVKPKDGAAVLDEYSRAFRRAVEFLVDPVQAQREAMAREKAANNLRQLGLAIRQHPEFAVPPQPTTPDWSLYLLPYLEQNQHNPPPSIKTYMCPSDPGTGNRFGARLEPVPPVMASQLALPKEQGQVIGEVEKGKAADKAGLRPHDILLTLNGKDVPRDAAAFAKLLGEIKPDNAVDAIVLREGKRTDIKGLSLPEGSVLWSNYGASDASFRYLYTQPNPDWYKSIPDGTSNTILLGENWGIAPAHEGWKIWSKGDPILATTYRAKERFTTRQQEGSLVLTVVGTMKDGKATVGGITVREGSQEKKYEALDKVPAEFRDKVANLIELSAK